MIDVTVALPTWRSSQIIWLQLEALTRQETDVRWELIVEECESVDSQRILQDYSARLRNAGCRAIRYNYTLERRLLGLKWRSIALKAKGACLILAASDNYSPPDRIQRAYDVINVQRYDWTDTSRGLFYDIRTGRQATWTRVGEGRSGLWMACRTEHIRRLEGDPPERSIDGWMKNQLPRGFRWYRDGVARAGVHTDGANTISHRRAWRYAGPVSSPFVRAEQDASEILPDDVMTRLKDMSVVLA